MKERLKEEKGITLIALVITIIVLLILAGVVIQMLTGDNGILKQASMAREETDLSSAEEKLRVALLELIRDKKNKAKLYDINEFNDKSSKNYQKDIEVTPEVMEEDIKAKVIVDGKYEFYIGKDLTIVPRIKAWDGKTVSKGLYGLGTKERPFLIQSIEDLVYMNNQVNSEGNEIYSLTDKKIYKTARTGYYELKDDIMLNETNNVNIEGWETNPPNNEWTPIGENDTNAFNGIFNGYGHYLIGFYIGGKEGEGYKGVFGITKDITIKNVNLIDSYISGGYCTGRNRR